MSPIDLPRRQSVLVVHVVLPRTSRNPFERRALLHLQWAGAG